MWDYSKVRDALFDATTALLSTCRVTACECPKRTKIDVVADTSVA